MFNGEQLRCYFFKIKMAHVIYKNVSKIGPGDHSSAKELAAKPVVLNPMPGTHVMGGGQGC